MPVFRSRDQYWPIRGQYSCYMISIDQSEASIFLYKCLPIFTRVLNLAEVLAGLTDTLGKKRIRIKTSLLLPKNVWTSALHYSQLLHSNNFFIMRVVRLVKGSLLIFFHYLKCLEKGNHINSFAFYILLL